MINVTLPKIAAIIIHWNQEALTRATIVSLLATGYSELDILLVDNGSTDGSGARLATSFPTVSFIRSTDNLGYAGGANLGLTASLSGDAAYHFLLNNDVIFDKEILTALVSAMEGGGEKVGLCVPKIFFFDEPQKIWYAGGEIDLKSGLCRHNGYGQIDGAELNQMQECTFANGCAMFIRRATLESVGLFDTSYFHTSEDVDFSLRLKAKGYRILFVPQARLWHKIRASAGGRVKASFHYLYYEHRGRILIMRRYLRGQISTKSYFALSKFYFRSISNEIAIRNGAGLWGILRGVLDGCRGIAGRIT
jgi:hypothetical protein